MRAHLLLLFTTLCSTAAWSADFYVAGSGNDRNNGRSTAAAFRTLQKAAGLVNAGDTVWVMNGTYTNPSSASNILTLTRSGTAAAPITWRNYSGHAPELKSTAWHAILVQASYQTIDGLILTGNNDQVTLAQAEADYRKSGPSPLYNGNGISLDNRNKSADRRAYHLTVRNCTVRKFGGGGLNAIQSDYFVFENNKVYECAWYSRFGSSGISVFTANAPGTVAGNTYRNFIRNNMVWFNRARVKWKEQDDYYDGNGIIFDVSAANYHGRSLVSDNMSVNNGGGGIHLYKARNADVINNTAYHNGTIVGYPDIDSNGSENCRFLNNIAYARPGGTAMGNTGKNNVFNFNIYFNGRTAARGANDLLADPLFEAAGLDLLTANFRLKAGSPALNSGVRLTGVTSTRDIVGTSRPQGAGIDRGAYERIVSGGTPTDNTPPATPAAPTTTSTTSPAPTLSGTTEANATVRIYRNDVLMRTQTANGSGAWSWTVTPALAVGSHSFTVDVRDAAGNTSGRSAARVITVADTTPPTTPAAPTANSTTSATPMLSGSTEPGATVRLYRNNTLVRTMTANGTGAWSWIVTPALAQGSHSFTVSATDVAGNTSGRSPARTVTVPDITAPATPAAPTTSSLTTVTPTLSGTTEANASVRVYRNNALVATVNANGSGAWTWTVTPALATGVSHAFTVSATDAAGNTSGRSPARTVTPIPPTDTTPPAKPAAPFANSLTSATPTLSGTTEPSAYVRIYRGDSVISTLSANATTGAWSWTVASPLAVGTHLLSLTATDAEDNTSARSNATTITVNRSADLIAPEKPAAPVADDDTTATPTLSGITEPDATVTIFADGEVINSLTAGPDGRWSWIVSPALPEGTHAITVTSTDASDNQSAASEEITVTVLTTPDAGGDGDQARSSAGDSGKCGLGGGVAAFASVLMMMLMRLRLRR